MKKVTILLAVALLVSSSVGCGCCRRFTNLFNRGAYCGPTAATPAFVAPQPQPVVMPPAPVVLPQANCAPQCIPCQPCCDPCCQPAAPCCETYGYDGGGWMPQCDTCSNGAIIGAEMMNGGLMSNGMTGTIPTMGSDPGPIPPGP